MAESASIQKVSIRHEMIMNYIMENPQLPLSEVAAYFGITQSWLSTVIHSPAFQDRLLEKKDVLFHHTVIATVKEKISVLAHKGLDRLAEAVDFASTKDVLQTTEMALEALGYVGKSKQDGEGQAPGFVNNGTVVISRDLYLEAQARIGSKPLEGESRTQQVPGLATSSMGGLGSLPALQLQPVQEAVGEGRIPFSGELLDADGGSV